MNQTVTCDAVRLEGAQRLTFLPDLFGGDFMTSEASVYAYAQRYCPEYQGDSGSLPAAGRRRIYGA
jgi:hypothetical protein